MFGAQVNFTLLTVAHNQFMNDCIFVTEITFHFAYSFTDNIFPSAFTLINQQKDCGIGAISGSVSEGGLSNLERGAEKSRNDREREHCCGVTQPAFRVGMAFQEQCIHSGCCSRREKDWGSVRASARSSSVSTWELG